MRCLVLAAVLAAPWPALAQDSTEQTSAEQVIEEIVVVGSLIRRAAVYEGRAPVQTLDAAAFEAAGAARAIQKS
ncbi:MAG: hypothetical protein F4149_16825 [Gammaproteobacteria bacterium]|nr:hypothetical protein [Gammaproteobacteria bacterium]